MNPLATALMVLAGMIMALLFEYVPGFASWYQPKDEQTKKLIMLGALVLAAVASMLLSCYSPYSMGIDCDQQSAWDLFFATVIALGLGGSANQATHSLTKRSSDYEEDYED